MVRTNGMARRVKPGKPTYSTHKPVLRPDSVQMGPLAELIGFHLRKAQNASFQAFARRVGQTDLSPGTFALLTLIRHNPGISQTALSRADGRDKSSLTPALAALERRGLILRQRLANNRRTYALSLTPVGGRALAELARHAEAHDRSLDRIVGLQRKAGLIRLLRRIALELTGDANDEAFPQVAPPHSNSRRRRVTGAAIPAVRGGGRRAPAAV